MMVIYKHSGPTSRTSLTHETLKDINTEDWEGLTCSALKIPNCRLDELIDKGGLQLLHII